MISSINNERVKYFTKLRNKKFIKEFGSFIVEGYHLVEEAIKSGVAKEILLLEGNDYETNLKVTYMSLNVMKKISRMDSVPSIMAVCEIKKESSIGNKIIVLDNVSDPGNVGTIIRSAFAFNMDSVVLSSNSVFMYNDKLLRATQGMFFKMNVVEKEIIDFIKELKEKGYKIISTTLEKAKELKEIDKNEDKYVIIVGNEGSGVRKEVLDLSDELVKIKMNEDCESLNVSVAASILMYYMEG